VAKAFGLRLCLIAFSVECLTGVLEGCVFEATIQSALVAGGIAWGLGLFLGELARHVIEEHVKAEFAKADTTSANDTTTTTSTDN